MPGGNVYDGDGLFYGVGEYGYWWSATESSAERAYCPQIGSVNVLYLNNAEGKAVGMCSVRCVQN